MLMLVSSSASSVLIRRGVDFAVVRSSQRSKRKSGGTRIAAEYTNSIYDCDGRPVQLECHAEAQWRVLVEELHVQEMQMKQGRLGGVAGAVKP